MGLFDVPMIGLYRQPVDSIVYDGTDLRFKFIYGKFDMQVDTQYAEITGINENWEPDCLIHLKRCPASPRQFTTEDVNFLSGDVSLSGTLYVPNGQGRHPAIVMMHGGTDTTRAVWTYRSKGDLYARHGYVVLVYDKRGFGGSVPEQGDPSLNDQAEDALAAAKYLSQRPEVDAKRIVLFGASQSGWAALIAATRSKDITCLVLHASPAVSVHHQELDRVRYSMIQEERTTAEVEAAVAYTRKLLDVSASGKGFEALQKEAVTIRTQPWADYVQFADRVEDLQWFHDNNYDPARDLQALKTPVLALYGGNDPLVPPVENVELLRGFLNKAGNKDVTIVVFPGGSHAIEVWNTLRGGEWEWPEHYWMWNKKAPGYYETILNWLDSHVRQ